MPKKCYIKPNRKEIRHWRERDVGRVVAYARRDGADDALLIAHILEGFGVRELGCLVFRILDILNTSFFLGAIIGILNGLILVLKGLKLLRTLKRATIPGILELIVPEKWLGSLGAFYLWVGATTAAASGLVVFLSSIANNFAIYLLSRNVCQAKVSPYSISVDKLDIGALPEAFEQLEGLLKEAGESGVE